MVKTNDQQYSFGKTKKKICLKQQVERLGQFNIVLFILLKVHVQKPVEHTKFIWCYILVIHHLDVQNVNSVICLTAIPYQHWNMRDNRDVNKMHFNLLETNFKMQLVCLSSYLYKGFRCKHNKKCIIEIP